MAIQKQINVLQEGIAIWNVWRTRYPNIKVDLSGADLSGANLNATDLGEADLRGANLSGTYFVEADLRSSNLSHTNLRGANLRGANLREANLKGANLRGARLSRADLSYTNLSGKDLSNKDLSYTDFRGADLSYTNLSGSNLSRARLSRANLSGTDLSGTDLSFATIERTHFDDTDLRYVKGLAYVIHYGPSYISTSTLTRSHGIISSKFLKGAGLDDIFIEYLHSLNTKPFDYYTCFISYSSKDELFARRLHNDLQQGGVRCWFAPENIDIGDKIRHRIEESIRLYDKLLLILSESAIASTWVAYEVERALNKEPQGTHNVLYPVRIDNTILTCTEPWALDIKHTRHIGNFENWTDPQQYEESFKRLLRALNNKKDQKKN